MKLSTILAFVFAFGLFITMGTTLFTSLNNTYEVGLQENISSNYDNIDEYYNDLEGVQTEIEGTESATESSTDVNFIANPSSIWSSIKLFFNNFAYAGELTNSVASDLGVPGIVVVVVTGLIILALISVIIGIVVRSDKV